MRVHVLVLVFLCACAYKRGGSSHKINSNLLFIEAWQTIHKRQMSVRLCAHSLLSAADEQKLSDTAKLLEELKMPSSALLVSECVCMYDYHIAVSIKTLAPFE